MRRNKRGCNPCSDDHNRGCKCSACCPKCPTGPRCPTGPTGPGSSAATGPTGPCCTGPTGPSSDATGSTGPTGPCCTGPTGPGGPTGFGATGPGSGAIIPFASGEPVTINHELAPLVETAALVAFGNSASSVAIIGGTTIDLTGGPGVVLDMAWTMPREGTLRSLSATYSNVGVVPVLSTVPTLRVQIWRAAATSGPGANDFTLIPGAEVLIPLPDSGIALGDVFAATAALNIPVANQERLVLVGRVTTEGGTDLAFDLTGYLSAGLTIE